MAAAVRSPTVVRPDLRKEFHKFGEIVAELLKLAALLVFGALMSPKFFSEVPLSGYVFAALALLAIRPIAIAISLLGSGLDWREQITAGWFGPKGFASVIYGLLIVQAAVPGAERIFHLVAGESAAVGRGQTFGISRPRLLADLRIPHLPAEPSRLLVPPGCETGARPFARLHSSSATVPIVCVPAPLRAARQTREWAS